MDAELKLCESLDFVKNREYLNNLAEKCLSFKDEKIEISNKSKQLTAENDELKGHIMNFQNSVAALKEQEIMLKKKYKRLEEKTSSVTKTKENFLNTCKLLGYTFEEGVWNKEQQVRHVKCSFNEECFVRFAVYSAGLKDLLEIVPLHPNFEAIQDFFRNTQDSTGLLSILRKYFKSLSNQKFST